MHKRELRACWRKLGHELENAVGLGQIHDTFWRERFIAQIQAHIYRLRKHHPFKADQGSGDEAILAVNRALVNEADFPDPTTITPAVRDVDGGKS